MKWLLLPLVFICGGSVAEPEPWGVKHWVIGATQDEARLNGRDLQCRQRWEEDVICLEREKRFGQPVDRFTETVAKYPAKVVEAHFWNDELIRVRLQIKADENRIIVRLLNDKFGQYEAGEGESLPPELRDYRWVNDNEDYVWLIHTAQADRFEIQIGSSALERQQEEALMDYTIKRLSRKEDQEASRRSADI